MCVASAGAFSALLPIGGKHEDMENTSRGV